MTASFAPDPSIQQIAEAYALDAVDFAKKSFRVKLDWSDQSVQHVEGILAQLHDSLPSAQPDEEAIWSFAKMLGSYVGEVYRKRHSGRWGMVTLNDQTFPGMQSTSGTNFWPWARAQKRIVNGPEDNMWHYYKVLLEKTASPMSTTTPPVTAPWWKRIFGG